MNQERVCELVKQLISLQEELKQKRNLLETLKEELNEAMGGEPLAKTPYGTVKLYAYDVERVSKEKVEDVVAKSQSTPVSNLDMTELTNISDVHFYRILKKVED